MLTSDIEDPKRYFNPERNEDGIPLPRAEQPRNLFKIERLNFGESVLRQADKNLDVLDVEHQKALCAMQNSEDLDALLVTPVDDAMRPDLEEVARVFGCLASKGLTMPNVVLSLRMYSLAMHSSVLRDANEILKTPKIKKHERIDALRLKQQAAAELAKCINSVQKLAEKLRYIEEVEMPEPEFEPEPVKKVLKVGVAPDLG